MPAEATTVLGPVEPAQLGRVLLHEHLCSLLPGAWMGSAVDAAVSAVEALRDQGIRTIVDLSPYGVVGRDPDGANVAALVEIARRTGVHIVAGTAVYLESFSPGWAREATLEELTARFVRDVEHGIGTSGVRAGILGEQATGLGVITPFEEKAFRAAVRAHRETGAALMTHTTHGTRALDQVDVAVAEGADLDRVVIGHIDTQLDLDYARSLIDRGVLVAIDTIGKQTWDFFLGPAGEPTADGEFPKRAFSRSDATRADMISALVAQGYADRIVLAHDLTGAECWMNPTTHGAHGYRYLIDVFVPMLRDRGVTDASIEQMLQSTPARLADAPVSAPYVIGVDLGGTHVRAALADASGQLLTRRDETTRDDLVDQLEQLIVDLASAPAAPGVVRTVIGGAGVPDGNDGLSQAPNLARAPTSPWLVCSASASATRSRWRTT